MEDYENTPCTPDAPKKETPIEIALNRLGNEIGTAQETVVRFKTILASILGSPDEKATKCDATHSKGQTSLETRLMEMTGRIMDINTNLRSVQNRVQL